MPKKKILVFIDWFLPGFKAGGPIKSCANIIAKLNNEFVFSVITRNTDIFELAPYSDVKSDKWNIIENGTRVYYLSKKALKIETILQLLKKEQYDLIYLNSFFSYYFSILPLLLLKFTGRKTPVVLAPRGMLGEGALEIKSFKKKLYIYFAKLLGIYKNATWHASSEIELKEIQSIFGKKTKVIIASNIPSKINHEHIEKEKKPGDLKLVFLSRISKKKNLLKLFDYLGDTIGGTSIQLDIIGPVEDAHYWEQCNKKIKQLPSHIKVNYMGPVDHDGLNEVLSNYHFFILPTMHENFGHVIFEALAAGCPVIISDQTPWKDLEKKQIGWDISLENTGQFTKIIEYCIGMQQDQYNTMSKNAHEFAREFIENDKAVDQNKKLFNNTTRT